jgi:hypothetical protein
MLIIQLPHFVETLVNSSLCQIVSEPMRFRQNQNPSTVVTSRFFWLNERAQLITVTFIQKINYIFCTRARDCDLASTRS